MSTNSTNSTYASLEIETTDESFRGFCYRRAQNAGYIWNSSTWIQKWGMILAVTLAIVMIVFFIATILSRVIR